MSPSISDIEKCFAKKPGFLPCKDKQVINFGQSRAKDNYLLLFVFMVIYASFIVSAPVGYKSDANLPLI